MNYGFIKVCAATPEIRVADVNFNAKNIINAVKESAAKGSRLTVFPELCVCGYTCGDLFNQPALINSCDGALKRICAATVGLTMLVFVGAPILKGGKLYNCAVAIHGGRVLGVVPKTYLPDYGEFYEKRYFNSADGCSTVTVADFENVLFGTQILFKAENMPEFCVAAEICEDLWAPLSPSVFHTQAGANIVVNLSCSDETVGKAEFRRELVKTHSAKLVCGYVYCDAGDGESTTDTAFAGHNLVCENGGVLSESALFENGLLFGEIDAEKLVTERRRTASGYYAPECGSTYETVTFSTGDDFIPVEREFSQTPFISSTGGSERCERILTIQQKGLEKRLKHTGAKTAVIGVSGGLDSALALLVTVRAFNALNKDLKDVVAVSMPAFGTTAKTKSNAVKLMKALGVTVKIIPVGESVKRHFMDIGHDPADKNVTYENAQARMRTLVLMDVANDCGGLVIGTGDLSELALGWATYNGDHMSMYGVNASVPKTLVKRLVDYEAERLGGACGKVLKDILGTEISPELLPPDESGDISQKTEDIVGPYILHDFFLYYAIRYGYPPEKIRYIAVKTFEGVYNAATVDKWLINFYKRFFAQQFKRSCMPDGVKVGSVSLSPRSDWRMPSDAAASLFLGALDNEE